MDYDTLAGIADGLVSEGTLTKLHGDTFMLKKAP